MHARYRAAAGGQSRPGISAAAAPAVLSGTRCPELAAQMPQCNSRGRRSAPTPGGRTVETRRDTVRASEVEVRCVLLQRAGGGVTVNEAMFVLSTKVAPVSMKTGTGERVPCAELAFPLGLAWWKSSSTRVPKYVIV